MVGIDTSTTATKRRWWGPDDAVVAGFQEALAAAGSGGSASVAEACDAAVRLGAEVEPGEARDIYDEAYPVYRDLYPRLQEDTHRPALLEG